MEDSAPPAPADPSPAPIAGTNDGPKPVTPAAPPVSEIVLTGKKSERELQLEKELEAERQSRKKVEMDNAQLTDELHRLNPTPADPKPADPKPRRKGPLGVRV